jgi:DNA-binding transcriptional MerR regulator
MTPSTVGAVARRLGLSSSRVAQLDREGTLPATMRDSAGRRLYDPEAVERFALLREQVRIRAAHAQEELSMPVRA